ncbi:copper amine oxidase N-terminal domain-containing protein [Solibacillus sp. MA9]|uniref:Copper amine oxidase N-terminal domain-containing protein n=1 Tax=Solibacillus palustris TaxID=2908203 RepID=A0ABS9UI36_9BACL|nr:copper amine oxidase N-terminal domain-containing protein [Solibacillus sp. MA9]MCH7324019.1 copper amine oxidase N-terminal domain-containing protein [Solibacillus sp. MA9]
MKKLIKYSILTFLAMTILTMPAMAESSPIKVFVNSKVLYDISPVVQNNRTLVPIRFISEELGFEVEYTESSGTISIKKNNRNIEITVDSDKAKVNNKVVELDVKPFIKENRVFIPLRFISESLGEEVNWDERNKIVLVGKYEGEVNTENTFLYTNQEFGYTLNFPNSWKEEAIIETRDGVLYVYDKKSAERFKSDGVEDFGPVFQVKFSDYPVIVTVPYDTNYILHYENGNYIETIFDMDFQYYPDTKDSYIKLWNEGQEVMSSFKKLNDIILIDKEIYKNEIEVLIDILDNFVPKQIFNQDEIYTLRNPRPNASFLYMRNMKNEEVSIKLEAEFDNSSKLIYYHLKSYGYELDVNKLNQFQALGLANRFIDKYADEFIDVVQKPDLYPSLYERDKHETYGDKDNKYVVVIDLEHGFVEYFSKVN